VTSAIRTAAITFAFLAVSASAEDDRDVAWGPDVNGLRVALSATAYPEQLRGVALTLQLENSGDAPLRIPGRLRLPWNWRFEFTPEADGSALVAHFAQPPEPPVSPPAIELASGDRFVLRFDCRHWLHEISHTIARPRPGIHVVQANSLAVGAEPDPRAWTGTVRSGRIRVDIAFRDPQTSPVGPDSGPDESTE